jgi:hypothetical protein
MANRNQSPAPSVHTDDDFELIDAEDSHHPDPRRAQTPIFDTDDERDFLMTRSNSRRSLDEQPTEEQTLPAYTPLAVPHLEQIISAETSPQTLPAFSPSPAPAQAINPQPTSETVSSHDTSLYRTAEEEKEYLRKQYTTQDRAAPPPAETEPQNGSPSSSTAHLNRGLQVPSSTRLVSSGFPYPAAELAPYNVTEAEWNSFTSEIKAFAQLDSSEWAVSLGSGAGTALLAGVFVGWFGLIPAFMVSHAARMRQERNKLASAAHENGGLEDVILKWNAEFWVQRGLLVRLDLPGDTNGLDSMDIYQTPWIQRCHQESRKQIQHLRTSWAVDNSTQTHEGANVINEKGTASAPGPEQDARFPRLLAGFETGNVKVDKWAARKLKKLEKCQKKLEHWEQHRTERDQKVAVRKGRIVIMPLNRGGEAGQVGARTANMVSEYTQSENRAGGGAERWAQNRPTDNGVERGIVQVPIMGPSDEKTGAPKS